jgi:hypothetical protein
MATYSQEAFIFAGSKIKSEEMQKIPTLILIGGNSRHIGKTTLACEIIRAFSADFQITAFKITSIYIGDEKHHGSHELHLKTEYQISRETNPSNPKDTSKMLQAGAADSFYIQALDHAAEKAWDNFYKSVPVHHMLVCESRSLRRFVEPGLFIYLKSSNVEEEKPYSIWLESLADRVLADPSHEDISSLLKRITIAQNRWIIF